MCDYWFGIDNASAFWWRLGYLRFIKQHTTVSYTTIKLWHLANKFPFQIGEYSSVRNLWSRNANRIHCDVRILQNPKQHVNVKFYHCGCHFVCVHLTIFGSDAWTQYVWQILCGNRHVYHLLCVPHLFVKIHQHTEQTYAGSIFIHWLEPSRATAFTGKWLEAYTMWFHLKTF